MKPLLKITQTVIERLALVNQECSGKLYGIFFKNTLSIIGLQADVESGINLIHSFPAEVDFCGTFAVSIKDFNSNHFEEDIQEIDVTDNPIFIYCNLRTKDIQAKVHSNSQIEDIPYNIINEGGLCSQFVHIRIKGHLPLKCEVDTKFVEGAFEGIRKNVTSGAVAFSFPKTKVYLLGSENENSVMGISGEQSVGELCEEANGISEGMMRKKRSQQFEVEVLNISMLQRVTSEVNSVNIKDHAPVCILENKPQKSFSMSIIIDALAMVHRHTKVIKLYDILVETAVRHLKLFEKVLLNNLCNNGVNGIALPETLHFYPSGCSHFITRIYLKNQTDDTLRTQRELLHKALLLPCDRPIFRRGNLYDFRNTPKGNEPLINPHDGMKPTDNGGEIALVKGKYQYYHYSQNKMDDNGWGCAYRSLQTLASWFKLQGYTSREVPTFKDIQKCLVDIGDKPNNFIGSRQWIGSTEVNFVLNTLLSITSKILYVSSGEEMGSKGPELLNHFQNEGSPVMIGGGVLAHTILGVDYNKQSGSLRFLILDPHYTGGEDLHIIQSKGWCGWKTVDFWDKTAYYNMCLPQVPKDI